MGTQKISLHTHQLIKNKLLLFYPLAHPPNRNWQSRIADGGGRRENERGRRETEIERDREEERREKEREREREDKLADA